MAVIGARLDAVSIERKLQRVGYYAHNIARDLVPQFLFRQRLSSILDQASRYDAAYLKQRVGYYNKLMGPLPVPDDASRMARIPMGKSLYYYDLKEHARYFPRHYRLSHLFGDINWIPDRPVFVKTRPIAGDNHNSILFKLDKFRHFYFPIDRTAFRDKKPVAVWRGGSNGQRRMRLVQNYANHPLCDVGLPAGASNDPARKAFLSPIEQLQFRYVISIEGHEVATNLKWIMASNSLCLMPAPNFESWFMEGRLEAGKHYVLLRDDFADLEEKIDYYERHSDEALGIIRNAHEFVSPFRDAQCEQLVSLLVLYKYFMLTGQVEAPDRILELIAPGL
jgi:Glycosyl transferase family 90